MEEEFYEPMDEFPEVSSSAGVRAGEVPPDGEPMTSVEAANVRHDKVSGSYQIFLIVMTIVFLAIAIVFGVNTYFYDKIRKNGCSPNISSSEAEALYWTNLILAVISGIMFIVCIILIFTTTKAPALANTYLHDKAGTLAGQAMRYGSGAGAYLKSAAGSAYGAASSAYGAGADYASRVGRGLEMGTRGFGQGFKAGYNPR